MSEGSKLLRLSKVAKEFNLSLAKIVEFLDQNGHAVEANPNAKIGDEAYTLLQNAFAGDKTAKAAATTVGIQHQKNKLEMTQTVEPEKPKKTLTKPAEEHIKTEITQLESPKILGKLELKKKAKAPEPEPEPVNPTAAPPTEEFIETIYEKLEGPKILGKMELPVAKPASSSVSDADKKKRKRIRKGGLTAEEINKVAREQTDIAKEKARVKYGDNRPKRPGTAAPGKPRHELSEEEIQNQIKETEKPKT